MIFQIPGITEILYVMNDVYHLEKLSKRVKYCCQTIVEYLHSVLSLVNFGCFSLGWAVWEILAKAINDLLTLLLRSLFLIGQTDFQTEMPSEYFCQVGELSTATIC